MDNRENQGSLDNPESQDSQVARVDLVGLEAVVGLEEVAHAVGTRVEVGVHQKAAKAVPVRQVILVEEARVGQAEEARVELVEVAQLGAALVAGKAHLEQATRGSVVLQTTSV